MADLIEVEERREKVVLFAAARAAGDGTEDSLDELAELCDTAGAEVVGRLIQNLDSVSSATYLGKGKVEELRELAEERGADGVVCDDELSPAQLRNLEDALGMKVMDRTMVILDIFAAHAVTSEGKIQVELAQLKYRSIRLAGFRDYLSRQGGGIGTRGPGEKKLEVDRRRIHERIGQLEGRVTGCGPAPGSDKKAEKAGFCSFGRHCGVYQCGKIHSAERPDRSGNSGGGQAVCDAGSHHPKHGAAGRADGASDGYCRFYKKTASQPD